MALSFARSSIRYIVRTVGMKMATSTMAGMIVQSTSSFWLPWICSGRGSILVAAPIAQDGIDNCKLHADEDKKRQPEDQLVQELDVPAVFGLRRDRRIDVIAAAATPGRSNMAPMSATDNNATSLFRVDF